MFAVQNIFTDKKKEMEAYNACDSNRTFRKLSLKELTRLQEKKIRKELPPDPKDFIPDKQITMFQDFGPMGWKYFTDQLFQNN